MCYSVSKNVSDEKIAARYKKALKTKEVAPKRVYVNGFSFPQMPVIMQEDRANISNSQWGFVPHFIKTERDAKEFRTKYLTLNAKSETVFNLKSFKDSIVPRRCIIPVTGFIEHRHLNTKDKIPYFIHLKDEPIFSLAGIYDYWTNENGETKTSYSILTTEANELMAMIHNSKKRMPLILPKEMEELWLDPALNEKQIKELMQPLDQDAMAAHTIAKIRPSITNPNDESMLAPFEYPNLGLFDLN